jgi:hypothetical protein
LAANFGHPVDSEIVISFAGKYRQAIPNGENNLRLAAQVGTEITRTCGYCKYK